MRHTASGINIDLTFGRLSFEQAAIEHCEIHDIGGLRVRLPRMRTCSSWSLRGQRVAIVSQLTIDRLLVRFTADDRTETVAVSELAPWVATALENESTGGVAPFELYSDAAWSRALEEYALVNLPSAAFTQNILARRRFRRTSPSLRFGGYRHWNGSGARRASEA